MNIDPNIFRNCVSAVERRAGISPVRFTQKQLDLYAKEEGYEIRSYGQASICIDVMTDAAELELAFTVEMITRAYGMLDLYIDDAKADSVWFEPVNQKEYVIRIPLPQRAGEVRRVTLYLPHNAGLMFSSIAWFGGQIVEPAPAYEKNLLCLGDSITQGIEAIHPSRIYPTLLARHFQANVINHGVGGYVFEADSLDEALPYSSDCITVAYGTNDWGRLDTLQQFSEKVEAYMERLTAIYPEAPIHVITPLWRQDIDEPKKMGTFADMTNAIVRACQAHPNVRVIDGLELLPHSRFMFTDGLHPTDAGFEWMAKAIAERLVWK